MYTKVDLTIKGEIPGYLYRLLLAKLERVCAEYDLTLEENNEEDDS